jgi:hypothetical protein
MYFTAQCRPIFVFFCTVYPASVFLRIPKQLFAAETAAVNLRPATVRLESPASTKQVGFRIRNEAFGAVFFSAAVLVFGKEGEELFAGTAIMRAIFDIEKKTSMCYNKKMQCLQKIILKLRETAAYRGFYQ